jgi:hypothetical protein
MSQIVIIAGSRAGYIRDIKESRRYNICGCTPQNKFKLIKNSNNMVIPDSSQVQRQVNSVLYSTGGITQFGNGGAKGIVFLGRTEGQPGGIIGPIRNKF